MHQQLAGANWTGVTAEFAESRSDHSTAPKTACYARALELAVPAVISDPAMRNYSFRLSGFSVRMTISAQAPKPPPQTAKGELTAAAVKLLNGTGTPWVERFYGGCSERGGAGLGIKLIMFGNGMQWCAVSLLSMA